MSNLPTSTPVSPSNLAEENPKSNNPESSEIEDANFVGKILNKDQFNLNEQFSSDIEWIIKYLDVMQGVTVGLEKMCISGTSYHFSDKTEVPNSGWRYMPAYLKKVEFIKKNEAEANMIAELCEKMGHKEEQHFYDIKNVDHDSNIYTTTVFYCDKIKKMYSDVEKTVKTCNRRRKKVEKTQILPDLRDQCTKYHKAVHTLDEQCRELDNLKEYVRAGRHFHNRHFKQGLVVISALTAVRSGVIKEWMTRDSKRQQKKGKTTTVARSTNKKNKSMMGTVKDLKKK
ncbi:uncharacterized protein CELE_ZK673.6 [Caenorhabditis elegans]|uniref:Uncharacterized protein ZK673.6 n=1 Tax=Caenorhabditis elegans TaxID=6239 RepID=YS56_CAEEL|nr:Uncharacterized protein CELE_ZK673.6 [Caenorhabditis elegans]Q09378.1 RecName: Full=Uncharacterized protein ZK673.6 [Caenorhabditis elegans]CAA88481.1 Uncharacterized protein CELE_ZK673.6 [Caenorhabditis elegans]|eukprot:NP_496249.1 Uncharacterized protein CELE_ZK673.6 [Caenorhabditis elegans]